MPDNRDRKVKDRRPVGRPPAGAKDGEKVKDYPQLSIRVPLEFKARLNALSAVTGLAQWRVIVEAINCFNDDLPPSERELVAGLSERLMRPARAAAGRRSCRKRQCQVLSDQPAGDAKCHHSRSSDWISH